MALAPLGKGSATSSVQRSSVVSVSQPGRSVGSAPSASRHAALEKLPAARVNVTERPADSVGTVRARLAMNPLDNLHALFREGAAPLSRKTLTQAYRSDLAHALERGVTHATFNRLERAQLRDAAGAIATVDHGAGRLNYRAAVVKLGPGVTPTAVIKANGYGQGATRWAKVLIEEGCKDFFVARIGEAVELRKGLRQAFPAMADKVAINVLDGNLAGADPQLLIDHKITPVLNSLEQVQQWNAAAQARKMRLPAILQFDSGMHRAGMRGEELEALLKDEPGNMGNVETQFIMSHLAKSDEAQQREDGSFQAGDATERQLANFNAIAARFPSVKSSIGASSSVFLDRKFHKDYVRLGGAFHAQDPIGGFYARTAGNSGGPGCDAIRGI